MQRHAKASPAKEFVVATEVGMLHTLERENPGKQFVAANPEAACRYMKMITLTKVRDALRDSDAQRVSVPPDIADRARVPIERMLSLAA
jgi:quinolinate synthase